jgi:uncharacterized cofD-like protein
MATPEHGFSPNIAVIGGGTGSFVLLDSLKHHTPDLSALVSMADDGGSTGVLRDELGVLPPGDARQCLVALSRLDEVRDLFDHRFPSGTLKGHAIGNVILSALEEMYKEKGGYSEVMRIAGVMLNITGQVVPVTLDNSRLLATTIDGRVIEGEHNLDIIDIPSLKGVEIAYDSDTKINPEAEKAIEAADMVVIAPGDLYTSIAPALVVRGMTAALRATKAKRVYVSNLVNKERHTVGYSVEDYVEEINRIVGESVVDFVIYNTEEPSEETLERYKADGEIPVTYDLDSLAKQPYQSIGGSFLSKTPVKRGNNYGVPRSLIRHDGRSISNALMKLHFT